MTGEQHPLAEPEPRRLSADVVVLGAGVAGLVAARECAKVGLSTVVIEQEDFAGGCVRRLEVGGLAVDAGASYFSTRGGGVASLLAELGLAADIVVPAVPGAWVYVPPEPVTGSSGDDTRGPVEEGSVAPLPSPSIWGVPANPLGDDVRRIVGRRGAARAWLDRLLPILRIGRATSFGGLVRTRMGDAVADGIVGAMTNGLLAEHPDDLDVDAVVPGLNQAMTRAGSLSGGVAELLGRDADALVGVRGGLTRIVDALVGELERFEVRLSLGHAVVGITRLSAPVLDPDPSGGADRSGPGDGTDASSPRWLVHAECVGGDEAIGIGGAAGGFDGRPTDVSARYLILATPASTTLPLLAAVDESWTPFLDGPWPKTPTDTVVLVVRAPQLDEREPRGAVLVPRGAVGVRARALADETVRWAWFAERAEPGVHVLRVSYDPTSDEQLAALDDESLVELALADASVLLGVPLGRDELLDAARTAHRDSISAYVLGRSERIAAVREAVAADPSIEIAGSWIAGPQLAEIVPDARAAALRVRHDALRVTPA